MEFGGSSKRRIAKTSTDGSGKFSKTSGALRDRFTASLRGKFVFHPASSYSKKQLALQQRKIFYEMNIDIVI